MADIPILFSAPMVQALIAGRKTMTRRLAWRTRWNDGGHIPDGGGGQMDVVEPHEERIGPSPWQKLKPGDRLIVKESCWLWGCWHKNGTTKTGRQKWTARLIGKQVRYDKPAEHEMAKRLTSQPGWIFRAGRYAPRWASRLTLVVTATKIERLQDISEADAQAEGVEPRIAGQDAHGPLKTYRTGFVYVWRDLHGPESWGSNPEVVAISFDVHKSNIDQVTK